MDLFEPGSVRNENILFYDRNSPGRIEILAILVSGITIGAHRMGWYSDHRMMEKSNAIQNR